jgi:Zn-dependent protease
MFPSLRVGRFFDIPVHIHWTFWLLPLWVILTQRGEVLSIPFQMLLLAAIFACIVLHEFGHALAARMYGIRTRNITLYPIGGVASLERISEKPAEELVIAAAGPAVNVVIAMALGALMVVANSMAPETFLRSIGAALVFWLIIANFVMVGFNLLPVFPLDGGRMFRALLGFFTTHLKATRIAVYGGPILTVILMVVACYFWPQLMPRFIMNPFLIVIAVFVFFAGQQELAMLEYRERMRHAAAFGGPTSFTVSEMPTWMQPPVRVYVWDPRTQEWVEQEQRR